MHKYESVIEEIAKEREIPLRSALDILYRSITYKEMRQGIADMHCRSDIYLAEEIRRETVPAKT
jgi:polyribonucleotide nucleotidyltransferase